MQRSRVRLFSERPGWEETRERVCPGLFRSSGGSEHVAAGRVGGSDSWACRSGRWYWKRNRCGDHPDGRTVGRFQLGEKEILQHIRHCKRLLYPGVCYTLGLLHKKEDRRIAILMSRT